MTRCSESPHSLPQQLCSLLSFHGDALLLPGSTAVVESFFFLFEVSCIMSTCLVTWVASQVATVVLWFVTCHRKLKCISGNWTEGLGKGPELCHVQDWWAIGPTLIRCPFGLMISRWSGQVTALRLCSILIVIGICAQRLDSSVFLGNKLCAWQCAHFWDSNGHLAATTILQLQKQAQLLISRVLLAATSQSQEQAWMFTFRVLTFLSGHPYHLSNCKTSICTHFGVLAVLCLAVLATTTIQSQRQAFCACFWGSDFSLAALTIPPTPKCSFWGYGCPLLATTTFQPWRQAFHAHFQGSNCSMIASQPQNKHSFSFWGSDTLYLQPPPLFLLTTIILSRLTTICLILAKLSPTIIVFAWWTTLVLAKMWPTAITFEWPITLYSHFGKNIRSTAIVFAPTTTCPLSAKLRPTAIVFVWPNTLWLILQQWNHCHYFCLAWATLLHTISVFSIYHQYTSFHVPILLHTCDIMFSTILYTGWAQNPPMPLHHQVSTIIYCCPNDLTQWWYRGFSLCGNFLFPCDFPV